MNKSELTRAITNLAEHIVEFGVDSQTLQQLESLQAAVLALPLQPRYARLFMPNTQYVPVASQTATDKVHTVTAVLSDGTFCPCSCTCLGWHYSAEGKPCVHMRAADAQSWPLVFTEPLEVGNESAASEQDWARLS